MPAPVTCGFGGTTRNYSTFNSAAAAWATGGFQINFYNDTPGTPFTATSIDLSVFATSATDYYTMTTATSQSFADSTSNPLRYNPTNGAAISISGYGTLVRPPPWFTVTKLQWQATSSAFQFFGGSFPANSLWNGNIFETDGTFAGPAFSVSSTYTFTNNLYVCTSATGGQNAFGDIHFISNIFIVNNTFALNPAAANAGAACINRMDYNNQVLQNNAVFGFSAVLTTNSFVNASNNATDNATAPTGTGNQVSASYSAQFVSTNFGTGYDFKLKSGAGQVCVDNGITETTYIPGATDIFGTARPQGSAWDIGCYELPVVATVTYVQSPPRVEGFAKPSRIEAPPALALTPSTLPVKIGGMAWSEPRDTDRTSRKVDTWIPPAIALTPSTLPPKISGMAWFVPRDTALPYVAWKEQPEAPAGVPYALLSKVSGIGWFVPRDAAPLPVKAWKEQPEAPAGVPYNLLSKISGMGWYEPRDDDKTSARMRIEAPPALALTPDTLPPKIAGMAWFQQSHRIIPSVISISMAPAMAIRVPTASVPISGMAWFEPRDDDKVAALFRITVPPALALTPATLPPKIAGMAWYEPPDRDVPPFKARVEQTQAAWVLVPSAIPVPVSGIAWSTRWDDKPRGTRLAQDAPATVPTPPISLSFGWYAMAPDTSRGARLGTDVPVFVFVPPSASLNLGWYAAPPDAPRASRRLESIAAALPPRGAPVIFSFGWFAQIDMVAIPQPRGRDQAPASAFLQPGAKTPSILWFHAPDHQWPTPRTNWDRPGMDPRPPFLYVAIINKPRPSGTMVQANLSGTKTQGNLDGEVDQ